MCDILKKLIKGKEVKQRCNNWVESQENISNHDDPSLVENNGEHEEFNSDSEFDSVSQCGYKKRRIVKPLKDEFLNIVCEWRECTFKTHSCKIFMDHIGQHIPELEVKIVLDKGIVYVCKWESCQYQSILSDQITWHVYYHGYHARLKAIGVNFRERAKLSKCIIMANWKNIPELPPLLICQWNECLETFRNYQEFLDHVATHLMEIPGGNAVEGGVFCYWTGCKTKFRSLHKVREHVRRHTKEKIIACPDCNSMFSSNSRFREHCERQISVDTQGYRCFSCNKYYPTENLLREHVRKHVFKYHCHLCEMSCGSVSDLSKHIRYRHLNERAFACQLCKHTAKTQQDLDYHMSVHTVGPNFSCDFEGCTYACKNAYILDRHVEKVHCQEVRWYCCHECPVKYQKSYSLSKHLMDAHKLQIPNGHKRFTYNKDIDGCYRVQVVRFEEVEAEETKAVIESGNGISNKSYKLKIMEGSENHYEVIESESDSNEIQRMRQDKSVTVHEMGKSMPVISNILISIDDLDEDGKIIRSKTVETQETSILPPSDEPPIILS